MSVPQFFEDLMEQMDKLALEARDSSPAAAESKEILKTSLLGAYHDRETNKNDNPTSLHHGNTEMNDDQDQNHHNISSSSTTTNHTDGSHEAVSSRTASIILLSTSTADDSFEEEQEEEEGFAPGVGSSFAATIGLGTDGCCSLSRPLWWLYYLHGGLSQSLPLTAIMYLMNSRIALPLSMLPIYSAIEFLPYSLKPIYAYLGTNTRLGGMDRQLAVLLLANAVVVFSTAFVPSQGVVLFFVLGFLRGLSMAWPELLMGLCLVNEANAVRRPSHNHPHDDDYDYNNNSNEQRILMEKEYGQTSARLQAQAATAQNIGSVTAQIVALFILAWHDYWKKEDGPAELNQDSARLLLGMTSLVIVVAAWIAHWNRVGRFHPTDEAHREQEQRGNRRRGARNDTPDDDGTVSVSTDHSSSSETDVLYAGGVESATQVGDEDDDSEQSPSMYWSWNKETVLVVLLQVTVIVLTLRQSLGPKSSSSTSHGWFGEGAWVGPVSIVVGILSILVLAVVCGSWNPTTACRTLSRKYCVGLYLVLRHVVPNAGFLVGSYRYTVFAKSPFLLQSLSLLDMMVLSWTSWLFGRCCSGYSYGTKLTWLLATTTAMAAIASLLSLWFIRATQTLESTMALFGVALFTGAVSTLISECSFLPEIVLATVALNDDTPSSTQQGTDGWHHSLPLDDDDGDDEGHTFEDEPEQEDSAVGTGKQAEKEEKERGWRSMRYGVFITCIDFGDQLGALVSGAMVSLLGVSRDNDWNHLEGYIWICAGMGLLSTALVMLLR